MATIGLALDCRKPSELAEFWKLALGYIDQPPPAPFATREEWIASFDDTEDDQEDGAWLCDPDGKGPTLFLQETHESVTGKNRFHIDVRISGPDRSWKLITEKAERLADAGATVVREYTAHHIWMRDPEGNDFCVC